MARHVPSRASISFQIVPVQRHDLAQAELFSSGLFQDKINLVADQRTSGANAGNVYVAWSQYNGFAPNNAVLFSRSTDHGLTFSDPVRVTPVASGASFADLAVGPNGDVYLTFITYASNSHPHTSIWLSRSTNGGLSFGPASLVANIDLFDSSQFSGNGSSDCGDAPFDCPTGLTFSRFTSNSSVAADSSGVHVVWAARESAGGQAQVYVRNSADGVHFSDPAAEVDPQAAGHQWTPDIASDGGTISVLFYDSRDDPAYSTSLPPGDTAGGVNSGDVVRAVLAQSTDGGLTWSETTLSTHDSNFNWETHGGRRVPFWGDYIYVSAVGGSLQAVWTDSRDLVAGTDGRDPTATDNFDGANTCGTLDPVPASNSCLSQGGLDQNIYTARV